MLAAPPFLWVAVAVPLAVGTGDVVGADGVKTAGLSKQAVICDLTVAESVGAEA
jgi:hypothetical protein